MGNWFAICPYTERQKQTNTTAQILSSTKSNVQRQQALWFSVVMAVNVYFGDSQMLSANENLFFKFMYNI